MKLIDFYKKIQKGDHLVIKIGEIKNKTFSPAIEKDVFEYIHSIITKNIKKEKVVQQFEEIVYANGLIQIDEYAADNSISTTHSFFLNRIASFTKDMLRISVDRQTFVFDDIKQEISYIRSRKRISYEVGIWRYSFSHVLNKDGSQSYYEFDITLIKEELSLQMLQDAVTTITEKITPIRQRYMIKAFVHKMMQTDVDYSHLWNRPIDLDWKNIAEIRDYAVTPEIDGEHRTIVVTEDKHVFIVDSRWHVIERKLSKIDEHTCIAEAKLYEDVLYIYDVLFWNGNDMRPEPLSTRIALTEQLAKSLGCLAKKYVLDGDTVSQRSKAVLDSNSGFRDGLVYTSKNKYTDPIYRWKPLSHRTVDFWVLIDKRQTKMRLYVSITPKALRRMKKTYDNKLLPLDLDKSQLVPYQFSTTALYRKAEDGQSIKHQQVVECRFDLTKKRWIPVRIRNDKTALYEKEIARQCFAGPNYFTTALSIYQYIQNPISEAQITSDTTLIRSDSNQLELKSMLTYHNWIKQNMYEEFARKSSVLELCGGRVEEWNFQKVETNEILLVVDMDQEDEASKRWKQIDRGSSIRVKQTDLREYAAPFATLDGNPFDVVSCQMSIQNFFEDELSFENFYGMVKNSLKSGGYFMFTALNGSRVQTLLQESDNEFTAKSTSPEREGVRLIQIRTQQSEDDNPTPFQKEFYLYLDELSEGNECLVDIDWLLKRISSDFDVVKQEPFSVLHDQWTQELRSELQKYSFLHDCIVMQKK